MATKEDIAKVVTMLSAAYPNWQPNQYTAEIYFQDLRDIDTDLLMVAVKHCRTTTDRDQRFAPSAGEIRLAVSDIKRQAQGIPSAAEAWHEVKNAKYRDISEAMPLYSGGEVYTSDPNPYKWSHPLSEKVARLMGWPRFPNSDNESIDRAHFFKAYEIELQAYMKQDAQPQEVRGYIESRQIKQLTKGMSK